MKPKPFQGQSQGHGESRGQPQSQVPRRGRPRKGTQVMKKVKPKTTPMQSKLRNLLTEMKRRPIRANNGNNSYLNPVNRAGPSSTVTNNRSRPVSPSPATPTPPPSPVSSDTDSITSDSDSPPTPPTTPMKNYLKGKVKAKVNVKGSNNKHPQTPTKASTSASAKKTDKTGSKPTQPEVDERSPAFPDPYLYSLAPYPILRAEGGGSDPGFAPSLSFRTLIGNKCVNFASKAQMDQSYHRIIRLAWNESFQKVIRARLNIFHVIRTLLDFAYLNLAYLPENRPKDLIFYKCDYYTLLKCSQELDLQQPVRPVSFRSVAFVQCDLGGWEDVRALLGWWLNLGSLRAVSFSQCWLDDRLTDLFFEELLVPSGMGAGIQRLEVETNCGNISLSKLFRYLPSLVSLSQRHACICPVDRYTGGMSKAHVLAPNISGLIQAKGPTHWEELEWDTNPANVPEGDVASTYATLSAGCSLQTLTLSVKDLTPGKEKAYREFLKCARKLQSLEIKGPITTNEKSDGTEVSRILELCSPIRNQMRHLSILDVVKDPPSPKKLRLSTAISQFEYLKSFYISNCDFFDINESLTRFIFSRPSPTEIEYARIMFSGPMLARFTTSLTHLEVRGMKVVDWNMVGKIADYFPLLEKLDISGINTSVIPMGGRDQDDFIERCNSDVTVIEDGRGIRHPVHLIFMKCSHLEELCMDDLELWDDTLWAGLDEGVATDWLGSKQEKKETLCPTLADLKDLQKLSLKRTYVSNITVRCVGRFTDVKFLNVSYTHVNSIGINNARSHNPLLRVIAEGCNITSYAQSEFRSPYWGRYISPMPVAEPQPQQQQDPSEPQDLSTNKNKPIPTVATIPTAGPLILSQTPGRIEKEKARLRILKNYQDLEFRQKPKSVQVKKKVSKQKQPEQHVDPAYDWDPWGSKVNKVAAEGHEILQAKRKNNNLAGASNYSDSDENDT